MKQDKIPTYAAFLNIVLETLARELSKKNTCKVSKLESKILSLFAHGIRLYTEHSKDSPLPKKLLELTNKFRKISEYKINIQKSVTYTLTANYLKKN